MTFIDEQRSKESRGAGAKPFTDTRVHLVHISNDPGSPCFDLSDGWRERLDPRAARFLDLSKQIIRCEDDALALEHALRGEPFSWLMAPIDALLNVRIEHSRQVASELRETFSVPRNGYVLEMRELSSALADAYGRGPKMRGHSESEIAEASAQRLQAAERYASGRRDLVRGSVGHGLSAASADLYFKALSEWLEAVRRESNQADCHQPFRKSVAPPLGWTLSRRNQEMMLCLSVRDGLVGGVLGRSLEPPDFPRFGEEYIADESRLRSRPNVEHVAR